VFNASPAVTADLDRLVCPLTRIHNAVTTEAVSGDKNVLYEHHLSFIVPTVSYFITVIYNCTCTQLADGKGVINDTLLHTYKTNTVR